MTVSDTQKVLSIINGTDILDENWDDRFMEVRSTVSEFGCMTEVGNATVAYESLAKAIYVGVQTTYDNKIRDFWRMLQIYSYQLSRIFELLYAAKLCELEILDITLMDTDHTLEDI